MLSTRDAWTTAGVDSLAVRLVQCKSAASRSRLPGLDWAINPYRGCSHACAYCYSQDVTRFELSKPWGEVVEVKVNIVDVLKKELRRGARGVYGIGTVTDPYQPLEKQHEITRGCLGVLKSAGAKISILTKSDLVLRDLDLLRDWPGAEVGVSAASLDERVSRLVETGAPSPPLRLDALAKLSSEGVETYLMVAPVIHGLSDSEESLRMLVGKAHAAHVPRIIWDKFNPKPMATSRLRRALASRSLGLERDSEEYAPRVRRVLQAECRSVGIELVDAF